MLPENVKNYLELLPKDKNDEKVIREINYFKKLYNENYINSIIWTQEEAELALDTVGVDSNTTFYTFYLNSFEQPVAYRSENIYGLSEILENYQQPFWGDKYPNIERRYLQLSSIEGEYSYFYDKETDALYGVDWGEMDDFMNGNLKPLFTSFYDFLEWYYGEEDED